MRMQKEEKIVIVLLLMALGSLAVANWAFGIEEAGENAAEVKINLEGQVLEMKPTKAGGHLLIRLDSTQMPIFMPREAGAEEIRKRVNHGDRVRISGKLMEYKGNKEIRVDRVEDIEPVH